MLHAVIMAGGSGTRFWPESRSNRPKQLLPLAGERSLLQETVDRLGALIPPERVIIATAARLASAAREQLPQLPASRQFSASPASEKYGPLHRPGGAACVAARSPGHDRSDAVGSCDRARGRVRRRDPSSGRVCRSRTAADDHVRHQADLSGREFWLHRTRGAACRVRSPPAR